MKPLESQFANFFDLSQDLLCVTDSDGYLRRVNPAFEKILGFKAEEFLTRPVLDFIHPDDIETTLAHRDLLASGQPVRFENRYRTKAGNYLWVAWQLTPGSDGLRYAIGRDVTRDKEREQELRDMVQVTELAESQREQAFEKVKLTDMQIGFVLNAATEGFLLVDADREIVWANVAIRRMFGLESVDLVGRSSLELRPVLEKSLVDPVGFFKGVRDVYLNKTEIVQDEHVEVKYPVPMTLSRSSVPVVTPEDEYLGRLWVYRDVSKSITAERAKSEFVSVVSHELRTPLTSIQGAMGLLASGQMGEFDEQSIRLLQIADTNTRRLIRLVNDILDLERMESGLIELVLERHDVREIVNDAIEVTELGTAASTIEITNSLASVEVKVDRDRMLQVFLNLIDNAIKFSEPGGKINISSIQTPENIEFTVSDSGPGISPDRYEGVFDRFEQVDSSDRRQKGGTGLGLAICKTIVVRHGGKIWVDSLPGKGSDFHVSIPYETKHETKPKAESSGRVGSNRVLVVEDDGSLGEVINHSLKLRGIEAVVVPDATEGISHFMDSPPQVFIVDIGLPGMNGIEMLEALSETCQNTNTRVVLYSARETAARELGTVEPLINAVLLKSKTSVEQLVDCVLDLLSSEKETVSEDEN